MMLEKKNKELTTKEGKKGFELIESILRQLELKGFPKIQKVLEDYIIGYIESGIEDEEPFSRFNFKTTHSETNDYTLRELWATTVFEMIDNYAEVKGYRPDDTLVERIELVFDKAELDDIENTTLTIFTPTEEDKEWDTLIEAVRGSNIHRALRESNTLERRMLHFDGLGHRERVALNIVTQSLREVLETEYRLMVYDDYSETIPVDINGDKITDTITSVAIEDVIVKLFNKRGNLLKAIIKESLEIMDEEYKETHKDVVTRMAIYKAYERDK